MAGPFPFILLHTCDHGQVSDLITLETYIKDHLKVDKKFKAQKERKAFLRSKGVKTVRDPKSGRDCVAVEVKTQLVTGKRFSASRTKQYDHDDKNASKEAFTAAASSIAMDERINTKVGGFPACFLVLNTRTALPIRGSSGGHLGSESNPNSNFICAMCLEFGQLKLINLTRFRFAKCQMPASCTAEGPLVFPPTKYNVSIAAAVAGRKMWRSSRRLWGKVAQMTVPLTRTVALLPICSRCPFQCQSQSQSVSQPMQMFQIVI